MTTTIVTVTTRKEQGIAVDQFCAAHPDRSFGISRTLTEVYLRSEKFWRGGEEHDAVTHVVRYVGPKDWEDPIDRIMKRKRARRGYRR